jgi:maltose O-acetyltransferase
MLSEKQKMLAGFDYIAADPELINERSLAHAKCHEYNATPGCFADKSKILAQILGSCGADCYIEPPFFLDYGYNLHLGRNVYMNFNCVILDCAPVKLGDFVKFGPNVQLFTAGHALDGNRRLAGYEFAQPITIGSNVWVGGGSIVLPGVEIGDNTVIGAGSLVSRSIPENVVAFGNPCRVVRSND